jgi:hypothetical protein
VSFSSPQVLAHQEKKVGNEGTWSQKQLEQFADDWATKFVQTNLCSQLASWLGELDCLFPEEFPFGTFRIGRSCFAAMAVTENYQATLHIDRDLLNSVISWFLEGKRSLSHLFILDTTSFSRGKETIAYFRTNTKIMNLVEAR